MDLKWQIKKIDYQFHRINVILLAPCSWGKYFFLFKIHVFFQKICVQLFVHIISMKVYHQNTTSLFLLLLDW